MRRFVGWQALFGLVLVSSGGCAGEDPEPGKTASTEWTCDQGSERETCTAVSAMTISDHEIYSCSAGEADERCPPADLGGARPWACSQTRRDLSCLREVKPAPSGGGDENGVPTGGDDSGVPTDCDSSSWKVHFGELAVKAFADHGLTYTFHPEDVPDTLMMVAGPPNQEGLPGCSPMITDLEQASWLGVVNEGCMDLSMEITAWCHNTHIDAAKRGVCNYGAGW